MNDEHPDDTEQGSAPVSPESDKHTLKEGIRGGAAKAWGVAVEVGSLLSGESGTIVDAQRDLAAANAEELIDRFDGEG